MSFKLSASVQVTEWKSKFDLKREWAIVRLLHLHKPFRNPSSKDAASLADAYVLQVAPIYGINPEWLASLRDQAPDKAPVTRSQLLRAHEKVTMQTHVVSYEQTQYGLPIWEAGLTALVRSNPLGVTSSYHTLHADVTGVPRLNALAPFAPGDGQKKRWIKVLCLTASQVEKFLVNRTRLLIYRFDPERRVPTEAEEPERSEAHQKSCQPILPLPPLPKDFAPGQHYIVTELLFTLPLENWGSLNWRAFVEVETGAVLYLQALVGCATGAVFVTDPMTGSGGTTPASPVADLNPLGTSVPLPGITGSAPWALKGNYVWVKEVSPPIEEPPTSVTGDFTFDANTHEFAAVNAYYHCDSLFRLMESMGFNMTTYFDGTAANPGFPIPVDHRGVGDSVQAFAKGNTTSDGCKEFIFGRAQLGANMGMACDARMVAHEFCHALLWDSVHAANFGFAHSAGDALAAIWHDPGSRATDLGLNFPWLGIAFAWRRHDRALGDGYVWGGSKDRGPYSGEYSREDILTTTLFRIYSVIGGEFKASLAIQRAAARKVVYLIIRGIGSLSPTTPTPIPDFFADALMTADAHSPVFDNVPGGTVHKVIRWSFEKQGLYQPPTRTEKYEESGSPPPVDVFVDDGREGEYSPYLEDISKQSDIWNRQTATPGSGPTDHQPIVLGTTNYLFAQIQNRGTAQANNVVVSAFRGSIPAPINWPGDWQPLGTASLPLSGGIAPLGSAIVGPFARIPIGNSETLLVSVSADGDPSNADPASSLPCALGPTPINQLVPFDNNIALRKMSSRPRPPTGLRLVPSFSGVRSGA